MLPLDDVLDIFWQWRLASICIEVQFFSCEPKSPGAVRMHVDGLVSQVNPEGIITVSGAAGEIELDLRQCAVKYLKDKPGLDAAINALDPDCSLHVTFPTGEICLLFPYRRASASGFLQQRLWQRDLVWPGGKLSSPSSDPRPTGHSPSDPAGYDNSSPGGLRLSSVSPLSGWLGIPVAPAALLVLFSLMTILTLIPWSFPKFLHNVGYSRKMADPGAMVWTIQSNGSYYCAGSVLDGRQPGKHMSQADALTVGYQPAAGRYCGGVEQHTPFTSAVGKGKTFLSKLASLARRFAAES
ncbi:MAG TPA: hypothetical protein VGS20_12545 [Candidatus Acidoferrales bacterium]|nr:hypothetical protein [Candidatus Acidoferrales bacterium]